MLTIIKRQPIGVLKVMAILSAFAMLLVFAGCGAEGIGESGSGADGGMTTTATGSTAESESADSENTQSGETGAVTESTGNAKESSKSALSTNKKDTSGADSEDVDILDTYHTPTIDENFENNKVVVIFKHAYSIANVNKIFAPADFPGLDVEAVETIYENPTPDTVNWEVFHQMLWLTLKTESKQHVLDTISFLEGFEGLLVAEPKYKEIREYN